MSTTPQLTDDELRTRWKQQAAERAFEFIQVGRNLTDEKSTPATHSRMIAMQIKDGHIVNKQG